MREKYKKQMILVLGLCWRIQMEISLLDLLLSLRVNFLTRAGFLFGWIGMMKIIKKVLSFVIECFRKNTNMVDCINPDSTLKSV